MDKWIGCTGISSVFWRTLSPLGLLPCIHSSTLQQVIKQGRARESLTTSCPKKLVSSSLVSCSPAFPAKFLRQEEQGFTVGSIRLRGRGKGSARARGYSIDNNISSMWLGWNKDSNTNFMQLGGVVKPYPLSGQGRGQRECRDKRGAVKMPTSVPCDWARAMMLKRNQVKIDKHLFKNWKICTIGEKIIRSTESVNIKQKAGYSILFPNGHMRK